MSVVFNQKDQAVIRTALTLVAKLPSDTLFSDREWVAIGRGWSLLSLADPCERAEVIRQLR